MPSITVSGNTLTFNAIIYVDAVNGNDSTGNGTQSLPYATLEKAKAMVNTDGTGVAVANGVYTNTNGLISLLTSAYTVTYVALNPGNVTMYWQNTNYGGGTIQMSFQNTFIGFVIKPKSRSTAVTSETRSYEYFFDGAKINLSFQNCVFDKDSLSGTFSPTNIIYAGNSGGATVTKLEFISCSFNVTFSATDSNTGYVKTTTITNCIFLDNYTTKPNNLLSVGGLRIDYVPFRVNTSTAGVQNGTYYWAQHGVNNVKTDPSTLSVGNVLVCSYTSLTSGSFGVLTKLGISTDALLSATAPSATPNGSFYFIYVGKDTLGRMKLIADRNIQSSITWDTLNTAGVATGSGVGINNHFLDVTNGLPSSAFSASTIYNSSYPASRAFDNVWNENNGGWQTAAGSVPVGSWIQVDLGSGVTKSIAKMNVQQDAWAVANTRAITGYKIQASNDGSTWVDQYTGTLALNTSIQPFTWTPTGAFRYWRFYITSCQASTGWTAVSEMEFFESTPTPSWLNNYSFLLRLPTGGTSSTDTADEWDNYVVNSNLGGYITAGDNSIWNWSGLYTWSSTGNSTNGSAYRTLRGNGSVSTSATTTTNATNGFRPVLIMQLLSSAPTFSGSVSPTQIAAGQSVGISGNVVSTFGNQVQYNIFVGSTQIYPASGYTSLSNSPASVNYTISDTSFAYGANTVTINMKDSAGTTGTYTTTVTKVYSPPTFTGSLSATSTHSSNLTLTGSVNSPDSSNVSYQILVNGVQKYPASGYTALTAPPVSVSYVVQNTDLSIGSNTVTLNILDSQGKTATWTGTITVTDNAPTAVVSLSATSVHYDNVIVSGTLTDPEGDSLSYRISLNGSVVQDWSTASSPANFNYTINNSNLVMGANTVTIDYKDLFKTGVSGTSWTGTVTKTNNPPVITGGVNFMTLSVTISDPDNDVVNYTVSLNGKQFFPSVGNTANSTNTPTYSVTFTSDQVNVGSNNTVLVSATDSMGATTTQAYTFVGQYVGLMFADQTGSFYSTDMGVILQYLDIGLVYAGQTSESFPVRLINKTGFAVNNIVLTKDETLLTSGVHLEMSMSDSPFAATSTISHSGTMQLNDEFTFFVRIVTTIVSQPGQGQFDVLVTGTPA